MVATGQMTVRESRYVNQIQACQSCLYAGGRRLMPNQRPRRRLSPKPVLDAIIKSKGNLAAVARRFGVVRQSVQSFIADKPDLQQAVADAREEICDEAESGLLAAVKKKESWAIAYTLSRLGRNRGYADKTKLEHSGGIGMTIGNATDDELYRRITETERRLATFEDGASSSAHFSSGGTTGPDLGTNPSGPGLVDAECRTTTGPVAGAIDSLDHSPGEGSMHAPSGEVEGSGDQSSSPLFGAS